MSQLKAFPLFEYPDLKQVKDLYKQAFPDSERKPFSMITLGIKKGVMKGYVFEKDGVFAGLAFFILSHPAYILDYLAVPASMRDQGIGSAILHWLENTLNYPLVVEIESSLKGNIQAAKRKKFYLANGFMDNGYEIGLFGVDMEILSTLRPVSFDEYFLMQKTYLINMKAPFSARKNIVLHSSTTNGEE